MEHTAEKNRRQPVGPLERNTMKPLQVKIFTHCTQNINPYNENQVNAWLAANTGIEIVHLLQSESMVRMKDDEVERNLSITIFYREA